MNYYEFNGYNENRQDQDSETLTKLFNTMGNKILMDMSTLDEEYVFDVHVFYEDTLDMLIIRVHTDRPDATSHVPFHRWGDNLSQYLDGVDNDSFGTEDPEGVFDLERGGGGEGG